MVRRAPQVVLAGRQRPPRTQPSLSGVVVAVDLWVKSVHKAIQPVADQDLVVEVSLAVATVTHKPHTVPPRTLMPCTSGDVVAPGCVGSREREDVEQVAVLLVRVPDGVVDDVVLLDLPLDSVRADALVLVILNPELV